MQPRRDPKEHETRVIHNLVDFAGKDVLEVGCGDGRLTWRFAPATRSVLALDPDESMLARARASRPRGLRSRVVFQAADITTAELSQAAFDVAVLSWSL